ncbi:DUF2513 domain-containing protein [Halodurantibacterium flavum]|uniref:DUF2513 domain-containing protein n=1 Tax=Halodurantibacterium flavum TaxID=1382802 RepID=A0ABW4S9S9_9RHOB
MRRDPQLMRRLLLAVEAGAALPEAGREADAVPSAEQYHLMLLEDAGFVRRDAQGRVSLTGGGASFLDAVRNEHAWRKAMDTSAAVGGLPLCLLKDVGIGFIRDELVRRGVTLG